MRSKAIDDFSIPVAKCLATWEALLINSEESPKIINETILSWLFSDKISFSKDIINLIDNIKMMFLFIQDIYINYCSKVKRIELLRILI